MKYYIGADLGTSALKLLLTDKEGRIIRTESRDYPVCYPQPSWSEQNPQDWWEAFLDGVRALTEGVGGEVCGIGVAGQMHGLVMLDENDEVIRPAILWNDARSFRETDYLNSVIGKDKLSEYTGNIAFAGFTAPKLLWIKHNEPQSFARIRRIMLPKDYIVYRLTGIHSTDLSDASGMLLLDVKKRRYSKEMLDVCGIQEKVLPRLYESYERVGNVLPRVAKQLGLSGSVAVAAGAGDNAAAAVGTGTVGEGRCNVSLGTSGTVFIPSAHFCTDNSNSLHAFCHADGGYHLMGCMLSAASALSWLCESVLGTNDLSGEQERINEDMLGRGHVYFLPYLMGERSPINDTDASGTLVGMRPDTKREDILLAVMEGVAFGIRDSVEVARALGVNPSYSTVTGGGARSRLWMKILAAVLNTELHLPRVEEGPAFGAAILSAVADGTLRSVCEIQLGEPREIIRPDAELVSRYEKAYGKFRRIYPMMKGVYKMLEDKSCE